MTAKSVKIKSQTLIITNDQLYIQNTCTAERADHSFKVSDEVAAEILHMGFLKTYVNKDELSDTDIAVKFPETYIAMKAPLYQTALTQAFTYKLNA